MMAHETIFVRGDRIVRRKYLVDKLTTMRKIKTEKENGKL
jgi:hypothetical protein